MCSCMLLQFWCWIAYQILKFLALLQHAYEILKVLAISKKWDVPKHNRVPRAWALEEWKKNTQQQEKQKEKNMQQMITELKVVFQDIKLHAVMLTVFMILVNFQLSWNKKPIFSAKNMLQSMHKHLQIVAARSWQVMSPKIQPVASLMYSSKFWHALISWPPPFLGFKRFLFAITL